MTPYQSIGYNRFPFPTDLRNFPLDPEFVLCDAGKPNPLNSTQHGIDVVLVAETRQNSRTDLSLTMLLQDGIETSTLFHFSAIQGIG